VNDSNSGDDCSQVLENTSPEELTFHGEQAYLPHESRDGRLYGGVKSILSNRMGTPVQVHHESPPRI